MKRVVSIAVAFVLALPLLAAPARIQVIFEPGTGALLRWPLPEGSLPATFRLERNRSVIASLQPGAGQEALSAEDRELVSRYARGLRGPNAQSAKIARSFVMLRSLSEPAVARSIGILAEDPQAPAGGVVTYDVYADNVLHATSGPVTLAPTPPPAPPALVIANATRDALTLSWEADASPASNAAVLYRVYRGDGLSEAKLVSASPIFPARSSSSDPVRGIFVDRTPAIEKTVSYVVTSTDAFGRTGPAGAPVEVLYSDFAALDPPRSFTAAMAEGGVKLTWTAPKNPNRAGWRVVRMLNDGALGETLTPAAVNATEFLDRTAVPGVTYYYKVSAVNTRGNEGLASPSVQLQVRAGRPPAAPASIEVAQSAGRVFLEWPAVPKALGYRVERELAKGTWSVVGDVLRVPRFDDRLPLGLGGAFSYRVLTIGSDGTLSAPSSVVAVTLADTRAPLAPVILGVAGKGGKATVRFRTDGLPGETDGLLVLRSGSRYDVGAIVHAAPLPPSAKEFVDESVIAGTTYYYRMLAIDDAGNRSNPSEPAVAVTIGAPPVSAPAAPRIRYLTEPFAHVELTFSGVAPQSVRYVVQRQEDDAWVLIAGPLTADAVSAIDTRPPSGAVVYRVLAVPSDGGEGVPSPVVTVTVP